MYLCVLGVYMCEHIGTPAWVWRPEIILSCYFSKLLSTLCSKAGSLPDLKFPKTRLAGQHTPVILLSLLSQCWVYKCSPHTWLCLSILMVLMFLPRFLCFHGMLFYQWSHLSGLLTYLPEDVGGNITFCIIEALGLMNICQVLRISLLRTDLILLHLFSTGALGSSHGLRASQQDVL